VSHEPTPVVITPDVLLRAIADHEELAATCAALPGMTRERAQRLLRGVAMALQRPLPPASAPAAPASHAAPRASAPVAAAPLHRPRADVLSANDLSPKHPARSAAAPASAAATRHAAPASPAHRVRMFSDGASRGNPGPAGAGAVIVDAQGRVLKRLGKYIGRETNNIAEYAGVILGLRGALEMGAREIDVRADSELMIKQLKGDYRVKNEGLKPLFAEAQALLRKFDKFTLRHVPREENTLADEMSNRAIDEKM